MFDDVAVLSAADRERLAREFLEMNMISNAGSERHVVSAVEAMFLLTGRVPYGNQQALAGRHGETNVLPRLSNGGPSITPPRAGRTNTVASPTAAKSPLPMTTSTTRPPEVWDTERRIRM